MNETRTLSFSIDLEAELKSMTERQHLNAVHFAVQLVRHALRHRPQRITIVSTKKAFTITHDGEPFADAERALLFAVLNADASHDPNQRQQALSTLERQHGIDILALMTTADRVRVLSSTSFQSQRGAVPSVVNEQHGPGTKIVVKRKRRSLRQERKELAFYARYADAEIRYNRRRLTRPMPVAKNICTTTVVDTTAKAIVRLPRDQNTKRIRYYKHGVYFGVRNSVPADGLVIDAIYNAQLRHAEDNFRDSLSASSGILRTARDRMLSAVASSASNLSSRDFERAKHLLLRMAIEAWPPELRATRFFDAVGQKRAYSLEDFARRARRAALFYAPPTKTAGRDPLLPVLSASEAASLSRLLRVPVRPTLEANAPTWGQRLRSRFRRQAAREVSPALPHPMAPSAEAAALARTLHQPGVFTLAFSAEPGIDRSVNGTRVRLPPNHPLVQRAALQMRTVDGEPALGVQEREALRVALEAAALAGD